MKYPYVAVAIILLLVILIFSPKSPLNHEPVVTQDNKKTEISQNKILLDKQTQEEAAVITSQTPLSPPTEVKKPAIKTPGPQTEKPATKTLSPQTEPTMPEYTKETLAQYDGENPELPIYIALEGNVYDVTSGRKFYEPGGAYHFLAGTDGTFLLKTFGGDLIKEKYPVVGTYK